ncbi:hypothetical protein [Streptomyces sp. CBMA156]|uniref:hypothetical protein n=1 Tax=Streptomyces sp. CBMA156 TaxID=1930280 RepID=UPI001661AB15|nr:hypothetical protein [Streptomyces sp. CBMA156]MBD0671078.1 hypothetical protein [Streptomyces sp. CBMA156]
MGDLYEISITLDLLDDLSAEEEAELRWHLGLGPRPAELRIVPAFPVVAVDDDGGISVEDEPRPLLGHHGAAHRVGGVLVSLLVPTEDAWSGRWALTVRQEIHPDDFDITGELLAWLAGRASDRYRHRDGTVRLGWIRPHESDRPAALVVRDGKAVWR